MGFTNLDQVINRVSYDSPVTNFTLQQLIIDKLAASTAVANVPQTFWTATGNPSAGGNPANGLAGAVVCTNLTTGAIPSINTATGLTLHLYYWGARCILDTAAFGCLVLVDRIAHLNINNAQATGSFSPILDATSRLDTGEGAQIMMEITSALAAGNNVRTFTYTNELGTASRVTPNITCISGRGASNSPFNGTFFVPLQAGDFGVRSIQSTTLVSGAGTGAFNVVLVRPIARLPIASNELYGGEDFIVHIPNLPQIRDNACLALYAIADTALQYSIFSEIRLVGN